MRDARWATSLSSAHPAPSRTRPASCAKPLTPAPPPLPLQDWALSLARAIDALLEAGWPPVFVYMLDAAWDALDALFGFAGATLGGEAHLEPSFFAWAVAPPAAHGGEGAASTAPPQAVRAVGSNFGLPHR